MEYANHLNEYAPAWSAAQVDQEVARIREAAKRNHNTEVYKLCYSAIDLTTLSCNDSVTSVTEFARKAAEFYQKYPHIPNVASICIYPAFVETVGLAVDGTPMRITSVGGGFPAAQTFLEVKALEVAMAVENGADEIDIVLNVGRMLTGEYDEAANEVEVIRSEMDGDIVLKVIIESGALKTPDLIRKASLLSMFAGADFVKTSTGKIDVAATPEAAVVMCQAIRDYYEKTGRKVGFKAAGGVRTAEDGALYYTIVEEILGKEWLTTDLFRIGASSAANNILSAIEGREIKYLNRRETAGEICHPPPPPPPPPPPLPLFFFSFSTLAFNCVCCYFLFFRNLSHLGPLPVLSHEKRRPLAGPPFSYLPIPALREANSDNFVATTNRHVRSRNDLRPETSSSAGEIRCRGSAAASRRRHTIHRAAPSTDVVASRHAATR